MTVSLPKGWKQKEMVDGTLVVSHPDGGGVTINYTRRGFALGYGTWVKPNHDSGYTGRGWRERLLNDAITALNEIYKDEK